jgi:hypothetical protein
MTLNKAVSIFVFSLAAPFMGDQYLFAEKDFNNEEIIKEVSNNISHEYCSCSAFYFILSRGLRRSGELKGASKYEEISQLAFTFALTASQEGRTEEMAEKVTMARLSLEMKSMMHEIDNDYSNASILLDKYLLHCKEIMEDPDKFMEEMMEKILKRHNLE